MDKSRLVAGPHIVIDGEKAVEVWYDGKFIASVYGADGAGVRIVSKYPMDIVRGGKDADEMIKVIEVRLEVG